MPLTLRWWRFALLVLAAVAAGCAQPINPSFPISLEQANQDLARMQYEPAALKRPLVVIGGIADVVITPTVVAARLDGLSKNDGIVVVGIGEFPTFDLCRDHLIAAVEGAHPNGDPHATVEVDVVGLSLGGVVARYAALPRSDGKRLRIARLFTISSPLAGAEAAPYVPAVFPLIKDLRPDSRFFSRSDFLDNLNAREPEYPVYSYVRLQDLIIGPKYAALPGRAAWWVATPVIGSPHEGAMFDARILADIARRLRGEQPFTQTPPAPLPS